MFLLGPFLYSMYPGGIKCKDTLIMWVEMVADKTELLHSNCAGKMVNTDSSLKRTIYTYLNSYPASVFLSPTSFSAKWQVPSFELSQEI